MNIQTIKRINAPENLNHEFVDNDLAVIEGTYRMFKGGIFYSDHDRLEPNRLGETQNAYVVPTSVINDPTTPEHETFEDLLKLATVQDNARRGKKFRATKPGHVYINSQGYAFLYLGEVKLLDTETLRGIGGHAYIELGYKTYRQMADPKPNEMVCGFKIEDDAVIANDYHITVTVNKNPKTVSIDAGCYTSTPIMQFTGLAREISFDSNTLNVYTWGKDEDKKPYVVTVIHQ